MLGLITGMMLRNYNVFDKFFNNKNINKNIDKNDEKYNKVDLNNLNEFENNKNDILQNTSNNTENESKQTKILKYLIMIIHQI